MNEIQYEIYKLPNGKRHRVLKIENGIKFPMRTADGRIVMGTEEQCQKYVAENKEFEFRLSSIESEKKEKRK